MFSSAFLDQLQERANIASVVGQRVSLTQRGGTWKGLCPFHQENSPSFVVNPHRGTYHCFGCGVHGDVIDFVRHDRGLSFVEAVRTLAAEVGLPVPNITPQQRAHQDKVKKETHVLDQVAQWFQEQLASCASALSYVSDRGITPEERSDFRLGWDPGHGLIEHMRRLGHDVQVLLDAGLILKSQKGSGFFHRFRHRIIFPIINNRGHVIAFGGRIVPHTRKNEQSDRAKYVNSPETSLFIKGKSVYQPVRWRHQEPTLVVEGYLDVIAGCRVANAVAPLGTAMTAEQLQSVWKRHPEPIVCFDGDAAGRAAQYKIAVLALSLLHPGYSLSFVSLPQGLDPFSVISERGKSEMTQILSRSIPLCDYLWQCLFFDKMTPEKRAASIEKWKTLVRSIPDATIQKLYNQYFYKKIYSKGYQKNTIHVPSAPDPDLIPKILLSCAVMYPDIIDALRLMVEKITIRESIFWSNIKKFILLYPENREKLPFWKKSVASYMRHIPQNTQDIEVYWKNLYSLFHDKQAPSFSE